MATSSGVAIAATQGDTFTFKGEQVTVGPKCTEDAGTWICTTHGEAFQHNFAKDSHLGEKGEHVLAWNCVIHGAEVP